MKKIACLLLVLIFCFTMLPSLAFAKDTKQNVVIEDDATKEQKAVIKKIANIHETASSDAELQKELEKLGLEAEKTYVKKFNIETIDGVQKPVVVTEEEYPGFYDISSEVTPMGGTKSDLTLSCVVNRGYDEVYDDAWISLDYKFTWSSTEEINGSDDGWACNWDTEEAYRVGQGCDSDLDIEKSGIGGFGMTTDDDNKVGAAWVMLTPRSGETPWTAHGELTQEYMHTYGIDSPTVTFSVNLGMISLGVSGGTTSHSWSKPSYGTY